MGEYNQEYHDIRRKLDELSDKVQSGAFSSVESKRVTGESIEALKKVYDEVMSLNRETRTVVSSLDKEQGIQTERNTNIFYQLGQLEKRVEELERNEGKSSDNMRGLIEKVFMVVIGGLITYVFSMLQ